MIDRRNAEQAAERLMLSYVKECKCTTLDEAAEAIAILAEACGFGMCAAVSQKEATHRLKAIAKRIERLLRGANWAWVEKLTHKRTPCG